MSKLVRKAPGFTRALPASLLLLAMVSACQDKPPVTADGASITASTATVTATTVPDVRTVAGTVRAGNAATLSAKVMGSVTRVYVHEGQSVRAGQLLLEIDDRDARAQSARASASVVEVDRAIDAAAASIRAAAANASLAEATLERYTALRARGSVSAQEFEEVQARTIAAAADLDRARHARDQAVARKTEARAALTQADAYVDYGRIRAPFDGVVVARLVDPGAQAAPGVPLLAIEQQGRPRVHVSVDEAFSALLREGDRVPVTVGDVTVTGTIETVVPSFDAATRSSLVRITLPTGTAFHSGSHASVGFTTGNRQSVVVPVEAMVRREAPASLFVVGTGGIASLRLVTTGAVRDGQIEILSGVDAGETIVTHASGVREGVRVTSAQAFQSRGRS